MPIISDTSVIALSSSGLQFQRISNDFTYTPAEAAVEALQGAGLGDVVYLPGEDRFENRVASYWSRTSQLRPWAIVQPRDAQEVSAALRALVGSPGCQIAIRSGGHMAAPGASSIEAGVTIDLGLLNTTVYNAERNVASLGPSARWGDVYAELEKHDVMVAGGRERDVAVAGFLLGGGTSLYTCRAGFGCDQVVNFEVVLADGRIVQANHDEKVDLFKVLKGGGNNFGIVTRFDMQAFPASPNGIWDAVMTYPAEAIDELLIAHFDFTKGLNHKSDAHILPFWFSSTKSQTPVITAILTHLDGIEDSKSLSRFKTITGSQIVKSGLTTVAKKMETLATPAGEYVAAHEYPLPLSVAPTNNRLMASTAAETHASVISRFAERLPDKETAVYFVVHPFPALFGRNSSTCGGNIMGVENIQEDCILLQASLATDGLPRSAYFHTFKECLDDLRAFAETIDKSVDFRYLNYSDISQDPLSTYGEDNIKQMREVAVKYDPTGIFRRIVPGGFKISKVNLE